MRRMDKFFGGMEVLERAVPGGIIKVRSRYVTPHSGPPDAERGEDPALGDRGEALVASEDEAGRFYVSYLTLIRDEESEDGWSVDALYQKEHHEEFYCGEEFGELEAQLMPRMANIEPPKDLAGKKAWFSAKMEVLRRRTREEIERELKAEAHLLKEGKTPYPPEESILGTILAEIGALPPGSTKDHPH